MTEKNTELKMEDLEQVNGGIGGSAGKLPEKPGCIVYKISRGDTLGKIARRYGTTVDDIMAVNRGIIISRNDITAGYYIYIPD